QHLKGGPGLPVITGQNTAGRDAWVSCLSPSPIVRAELHYTRDRGPWQPRTWATEDAYLDTTHGTAHALVPAGATAYYLNLTDRRGLVVSSEHIALCNSLR
ncbi:MAG TPA: dipeptidyl aminopeptidase, partial [Armatimonadota bacterium]|nr:dipeptidyl aminopeptidase [Armatimonadota bacterium]